MTYIDDYIANEKRVAIATVMAEAHLALVAVVEKLDDANLSDQANVLRQTIWELAR